ncbi:MAG: MFS transporter [Rickettsiales bacterium]|jgi:MFS family permease|nr:MFS transporter [Rickettsiales bacterium]
MRNNSTLRGFLFNVYGVAFCNALMFLYPLMALMFAARGVSDEGVSILLGLWAFSVIAMQLPVNALASRFSYRNIVIFGQLTKIACFMLWIFWPTFWSFALGFVLWGIQWAIYDAVFESLVYEELKALKQRKIYTRICSRQAAFGQIAFMIAMTGSLMSALGYNFVVLITCAAMLMSIFFAARLPSRAAPRPRRGAANAMMKTLGLSFRVMRQSKYILYLLILVSFVATINSLDDYTGLIGVELGIPEKFIGGLFLAITFFQSMGNAVAPKLEKHANALLPVGIFVLGAILALFSVFWVLPGVLFLCLLFFAQGALKVLAFAKFQHSISSNCRTMFLSLYSICGNMMCIGMYVLMGAGTMVGGFKYGILFLGAAAGLVGLWALFMPKKSEKTRVEHCVIGCEK